MTLYIGVDITRVNKQSVTWIPVMAGPGNCSCNTRGDDIKGFYSQLQGK